MPSRMMSGATLAAALSLVAACAASPASPGRASTVTPTQSISIDYFVGDWTPALTTSGSLNGTPTGCSQFDYTIAKIDATSANVTYNLVCDNYHVKGTASGLFQDAELRWKASGMVAEGNVTCPFAFTDNTAAPFTSDYIAGDKILVTYNGTVCGIALGGDYLLKRKWNGINLKGSRSITRRPAYGTMRTAARILSCRSPCRAETSIR